MLSSLYTGSFQRHLMMSKTVDEVLSLGAMVDVVTMVDVVCRIFTSKFD